MTFSERFGYKKPREVLQTEGLDESTRTRLWNVMTTYVFNDKYAVDVFNNRNPYYMPELRSVWANVLGFALDEMPIRQMQLPLVFKSIFMNREWFVVLDVLEGLVRGEEAIKGGNTLMKGFNAILEREMSAYRIVGNTIVPITSEVEIEAVETALGRARRPYEVHLATALDHLSRRDGPDFRNSVKESISAVEAVVQDLVGDTSATLAEGLKKLGRAGDLPGALKEGWLKLYGWTSDGGGIRHALSDDLQPGFEEAMYMLVTCSSFINYLLQKLRG